MACRSGVFSLLILCLLAGCRTPSDFHVKDLAKTNIDVISEIHLNQATELLKELTEKLYKKNPYELKKNPGMTINMRIRQIFTCPVQFSFPEVHHKKSIDAILLGFDPDYEGDRVFAVVFGLYTMIHASYNNKCELFMLDYLNEQALYNSARNIEILVWRLNNRHTHTGRVFLLTNSLDDENPNLSYERLFGKLISLQDTMARIIADRTGRTIKEVVRIAGMAFLPIGI